MSDKRVKIRDAATGRVLLVAPIDAEEWVASGSGTRVTDSDADRPEGQTKRRARKVKQADLPAQSDESDGSPEL